jgi:hypothetical protein
MARYYFNVRDARGIVPDDEGDEFILFSDAMDEAAASARDLAKQFMDERRTIANTFIDVLDITGAVRATLTVTDVLERPRPLRIVRA